MPAERQREIARKGGRAAHAQGTAHQWSPAEAQAAGRKGGQISRGGRGRADRDPEHVPGGESRTQVDAPDGRP